MSLNFEKKLRFLVHIRSYKVTEYMDFNSISDGIKKIS